MKTDFELNEVPEIYSIQDMLLQSAQNYPNKLALEDLNKTPIGSVTYSELLANVLKFGKALQNLGLKERAHIALIGENRVQWAISYLALLSFNYVVVPIDRNLSENEIFNIIHDSGSEAVIFTETFSTTFMGSHPALSNLKHYICMDNNEYERFVSQEELISQNVRFSSDDLPEINPDEMCEIIYTSGSLGRAKGVMLSQKNLATNLMDMVSMLMMFPEDRFLSVLPIHHTYECTCGLLCPLYSGSSVHYARSLKTIVEDIQKVKATILLGVPMLYDKMFKKISRSIEEDAVKSKIVPILQKATNITEKFGLKNVKKKVFKELHNRFGGHIRVFIAGGAAPDPMVAKGLREFGFNFVQGYGLTETAPILTLNRLEAFKDNAAGLPLPSVKIKIVDQDELGVGEVYAKAPNVMLGYYKNPGLTSEVMEKGWFKTGDLGLIDKDGFLHIKGRKKNVIISKSGKNVFPEEIEDVLLRSRFVQECMVYGESDKKQEEIIAAQIFVDGEAMLEHSNAVQKDLTPELIDEVIKAEVDNVNKQLTPYKRIVRFHIRDEEFVKTTTQKIKRYMNK